jgi:hypothetical protein
VKPFSQELYDADDNAKLLVLAWLWKYQPELNWRVNPDDYGIDLVCDSHWTVEVEVRHSWQGHTFPFDIVHLPKRKAKFNKDGAFFVVMNHERTHALVIDSYSVAAAPTVFKDTKYTFSEPFIAIPLHKCLMINVTPGTDTINALGNERTATNGDGSIS